MIEVYRKQVLSIARELNCQLDVDEKFRASAMMFVEELPPRVEVPPITDQISYLINLHELGHVHHNHCQGRPPYQEKRGYFDNGVLKSEAQAWEFALDKCLDEVSEESRRFMWDACLGSYYQHGYVVARGQESRLHNGNRHHIPFVYDLPDAFFESIVRRIQSNLGGFQIAYLGVVDFTLAPS